MTEQITVRDVRNINKQNIIKTIISNRVISRAKISNTNNISVMTVKNIVDYLLEKGVISEAKVESSIVGRKPSVLSISDSVGCIISIDLTSKDLLYYVIFNVYKEKLEKRYFKCNPEKSYYENLLDFIKLMKEDVSKLGKNVMGLGIAVPGVYYADKDKVSNELINEFADINLKQLFNEYFNLEYIIIEHDVKMAAKAEASVFCDSFTSSLFYFYVGEGIGGSFVYNGEVFSGVNDIAGDVGQLLIRCDGEQDNSLESVASIPAILSHFKKTYPEISFIQLLKMYRQNEEHVTNYIDNLLQIFSRVIYNLLWVLNPHKIVVGSSSKEFGALIVEAARKYINNKVGGALNIDADICQSFFDENSALFGLFDLIIDQWIDKI